MCSASWRGVGLGDLLLHHLVPGDENAVRPDAGVVRSTTNMPLTHITNSSPATRPAEMNHFSPLMADLRHAAWLAAAAKVTGSGNRPLSRDRAGEDADHYHGVF
jgi:hypothetical protein